MIRTPRSIHSQSQIYSLNLSVKWDLKKGILILRYFVVTYNVLKLKLQYLGHLMRRADSLEKTLTLGKIEGRRRRGRQRMRWLDGITYSMDMSLSKFWELVEGRMWRAVAAVHGVTKSRTQLSKRTTSLEPILVYPSDKSLGGIIRKLRRKFVSSLNPPSSS